MTAVLVAVLASACVKPEVAVTRTTGATSDLGGSESSAPAGTRLQARLGETLDTLVTEIGQPFTAKVEGEVLDRRGRVLVPAGALVRGKVVSVGSPAAPRIGLTVETIETTAGTAPLYAALREEGRRTYLGPEPARPETDSLCRRAGTESDPFCDSYVYMIYSDTAPPHGFGRPPATDDRPREVRLPQGARLVLVLTDPLSPPTLVARAAVPGH